MANSEKKKQKIQQQIQELDEAYKLSLSKKVSNVAEISPAQWQKRRQELIERLNNLQ